MNTEFWYGNLQERDTLGWIYFGVDVMVEKYGSKEIVCEVVGWVQLGTFRVYWLVFVDMMMTFLPSSGSALKYCDP